MKNYLLILFSIFASNFIFAQSVNDLDIKNGFRHFKLRSSPSQIKNIVKEEYQFSKNPNVVTYNYVGNDIDYVFNVKVDEIRLHFFKNKLFLISVNFGNLEQKKDFELYEFNNVLSALEKIYGKARMNPNNEDGVILNGALWEGKNVKLEFLRLDFSRSKANPTKYHFINGYISVYDKKLNSEMLSSEF